MREVLAGSMKPDTAKAEDRTIDVLWYSGAPVQRYNWFTDEEYVLRFSMAKDAVRLGRLLSGAPVLNAHSDYKLEHVIGVVQTAWIESDMGYATLRFSERDEVTPIWNDVKAGILTSVSMGAAIYSRKDKTPKGEKMRQFLADDWEPMEISAVPIGADPEAGFLSFESRERYQQLHAERMRAQASIETALTIAAEPTPPAQPKSTGAAGQQTDKIRLKIALSKARFLTLR